MRQLGRAAVAWLRFQWEGPSGLPRTLRLEWRFVAVRWLGIGLFVVSMPLTGLSTERLLWSDCVLLIASAYNLAVRVLVRRRPQLMAGGYVSTVCDGTLALAMVLLGGGFDSPASVILFMVTLSAAMRYGYGPSLGVTLLYVCADAITHGSIVGAFVYRALLLLLTSVLAGFLREQAQHAEAALQERLRQSTALNDATAVLGASLDLESALRAAAAASAQMFASPLAVLQPAGDLAAQYSGPIAFPRGAEHRELERVCERYAHSAASVQDAGDLIAVEALPDGQEAIVLMLALAPRQASLGAVAVLVPAGTSVTFDSDVLDAFLERLTLAVENATLYRALADRSNDLQRAYSDLATAHQELLSVDEMKTNFIANVSHELRTPLTSIRSFSELLLGYDESPSVQKEFLRIINAESERLTRLVNDVLDISRIEAGHMDWRLGTVCLSDLLHDSAHSFSPLIELNGLQFEVDVADDLPSIRGDRDRLQQVLANLLNNAIKFTRPGGCIGLGAELRGGNVWIRVSDSGIGIAPGDQERIFEKFQQVGDTLKDKPKGTGLGLAISREIIDFHKGDLFVESEPGRGTTFSVRLPVGAPLAEAA